MNLRKKTYKSAEEYAHDIHNNSMKDRPHQLVAFIQSRAVKYGMCGDMLFSCDVIYGNLVLKLPIENKIHNPDAEDIKWFNNYKEGN